MSTLQETITHLTQKNEVIEEQLQTFGNFNKLPWNNFCPIPEEKTPEIGVALAEIQEIILAALHDTKNNAIIPNNNSLLLIY